MQKSVTLFIALYCFPLFLMAQGKPAATYSGEVPFTLQDRDRSIRIEERIASLEKSTNDKFSSLEKSTTERISSLEKSTTDKFSSLEKSTNDKLDKLYTLLYFILGGVFGLIGLIMWDRRSYIKPVKEDIMELQNALKDYAKEQPKLADILRSHGLL